MTHRSDEMLYALKTLTSILGVKSVIIGVEANKREAIEEMKKLAASFDGECKASVKVLSAVYPQGGEKVLIYNTTKREVPVGKLPIDVGCIVLNCTTCAAIGRYLQTGMPLTEKCVTVDGGAVAEPKLVIAPVGTAISELFEFCGGLKCEPAKVVYGGPMMGIAISDVNLPVIKNTNAVLALTEKETALPRTTACLTCGACADACPFSLTPFLIAKAFKNKDAQTLEALSLNACMECGCCSYICPANRPLVQTNKLAKAFLREEKAKENAKA
jgi:electron transport complex protein RnfC